jgi:hypothetical protein
MPFTISHAAVVPPFSRWLARWRLLSAVVIGTMVPDFGVFLPWRMHRIETHSMMGLLTFCLPVGLVSYWIFQYLIKEPVLEVLPEGAYARWRPYSSPAELGNLLQWVLASVGVLAGAVSHLVWDAFTHEGARGVRMLPWLDDPIVEIGSHHMAGARFMQDVSSLVGLVIVLLWVGYGLRRGHTPHVHDRLLRHTERRVWVAVYLVGAAGMTVLWVLVPRAAEPGVHLPHSVTAVAGAWAVAALRGLASAFLVTSLALDGRLRALRARSP